MNYTTMHGLTNLKIYMKYVSYSWFLLAAALLLFNVSLFP